VQIGNPVISNSEFSDFQRSFDLFVFDKYFTLTMSISLNRIVLSNFKSFGGETVIGPIQPFTAIIGPNGAGEILMFSTTFILFDLKQKKLFSSLNVFISPLLNNYMLNLINVYMFIINVYML